MSAAATLCELPLAVEASAEVIRWWPRVRNAESLAEPFVVLPAHRAVRMNASYADEHLLATQHLWL